MRIQPKQQRRMIRDDRATTNEGPCRQPYYCHDYPPEPPRKPSAGVLAAIGKMEKICGYT